MAENKKPLKTIEEHNAWRRQFWASTGQHGLGIECPKCHHEMINAYGVGVTTASMPPKLQAKCENCGHHEFIIA